MSGPVLARRLETDRAAPRERSDDRQGSADREHAHTEDVERELVGFFDRQRTRAAGHGEHFARLWEVAAACALGGKLLRPRLMLGAYDALAPAVDRCPRASVLRIAAAMEVLHYSFLLHDDVIDEDLVRRHRPNLIGRVRAEAAQLVERRGDGDGRPRVDPGHFARSAGILMGDLLLSAVHQTFAREPLPQDVRVRLLDVLEDTITETVAGEFIDVALGDGIVTAEVDDVLEMHRRKTAAYTFGMPLTVAAVLADRADLVPVLAELGDRLGIAFQLQDDLLSTFAGTDQHGKDSFSDLREGKETALIAYARTTSAWPSIRPLLAAPAFSDADGLTARGLLTACGAETYVRASVEAQLDACARLIRHTEALPASLTVFLTDLVGTLDGRRS